MQTLDDFILSNELLTPIYDGKLYRFERRGKPNVGWMAANKDFIGGKEVFFISAGDWSTGEKWNWESEFKGTPEEISEFKKKQKAAREQSEEAKRDQQQAVSEECESIWARSVLEGSSPYLQRKGLSKLYGARFSPDYSTTVLIPLRDIDGKLWNLQRIWPADGENRKGYWKGGLVKGVFHIIGEIFPKGRILVCEGFATGASIHEATGHAVVICFMASNLLGVCQLLRKKYPESQITVCGDDDKWSRNGKGQLWNVGREAAIRAAAAVGGNRVFPEFKTLVEKPTDFNDLANLEGLDEVKKQILHAPLVKLLEPVCEFSDSGNPKKVSEPRLVKALIDFYEGQVIQQSGELYRYLGTHWKQMDEEEVRQVKVKLQFLSGNAMKSGEVESAFKAFLLNIQVAPLDMFQPNPFCANFLNGTLSIHKIPGTLRYRKEFNPHSYSNYLTSVIPLNYEPEKCEVNMEFLKAVDKIFGDDRDLDQKRLALAEMFGACLVPAFPRIFFLVGPPGSGKSTFTILASRLVHNDNISRVEPHEFRGFLMESMVGKLVNTSSDIKTNERIDDAMMKKIEDRAPVRIDRKFKKPIDAWLPAVHIFGCNKLPPSYDGETKAFGRRATILEMKAFKVEEGKVNREFAHEVFDASPQGVLNFALAGLDRLLESGGNFTQPGSGRDAMEVWQDEFDPVTQFLKELEAGELRGQVNLEGKEEDTIERKKLWENFVEWHQETYQKPSRISRIKFYEKVGARFMLVKVVGTYKFKGLRVNTGGGASY